MWIKLGAALLLGGTLLFGAALVSKSNKPGDVQRLAGAAEAGGPAVETISRGEPVNFGDHVSAESRMTVFYFTADW